MQNRSSYRLVLFAFFLAVIVVTLGAYTRLTDAGLGCPDWPGCYGHMLVPTAEKAQILFPDMVLEKAKAWTEMAHRYAAGLLGFIILSILIMAFKFRKFSQHPVSMPLFISALVIFQALLGMWTVTMQLLPLVVMAHLLGGFSLLACLAWLILQLKSPPSTITVPEKINYRPWILIGLLILSIQIALGGWVSSNYSALACVGFPTCNGQLIPPLNFTGAFQIVSPIGINYEGGILDSISRVTIHFTHRVGAVITLVYLAPLALWILIKANRKSLRVCALITTILLTIQFGLGILNVVKLLPLSIAVAHNAVAAFLLVSVVCLYYYAQKETTKGLFQ